MENILECFEQIEAGEGQTNMPARFVNVPGPKAQYNFTDPDSRIMKAGSGQHFEQAYNALGAVHEQMLIVGQQISVAVNDNQELEPTVAAISPVAATVLNGDSDEPA